MKENTKKSLVNFLIVFIICFLLLFLFQVYQDYKYYSLYPKEELVQFFSMKKVLLFNFGQSFSWSIMLMIIFMPILAILKRVKIKNIFKIIITVVLTFVISFIYIISNLTITF